MNQQNDMRRFVMQAMQQHGGLSPRFQDLLQAMQGQQQQPANPAASMQSRGAQNPDLTVMDRGDINNTRTDGAMTGDQQHQAQLNHINERARMAFRKPANRRSAQEVRDIQDYTAQFGQPPMEWVR